MPERYTRITSASSALREESRRNAARREGYPNRPTWRALQQAAARVPGDCQAARLRRLAYMNAADLLSAYDARLIMLNSTRRQFVTECLQQAGISANIIENGV